MRKHGGFWAWLVLCALLLLTAASLGAQQEKAFVGSKSSKKFHTLQCAAGKKIIEKNRIYFRTAAEAEKAGYKPCKICKPGRK
jgi:methylphosphotriester-DNA--protein-cysteine methyltransferase